MSEEGFPAIKSPTINAGAVSTYQNEAEEVVSSQHSSICREELESDFNNPNQELIGRDKHISLLDSTHHGIWDRTPFSRIELQLVAHSIIHGIGLRA